MAAAYVGEVADETSGLAVIDALEMTGEFHMEGVLGNLDITVTDIRWLLSAARNSSTWLIL